jgi:sigma-B regulation protein RsbU (phosphoserine phosphatase)
MWMKSIKTKVLLLIVLIMVVALAAVMVFTKKDFEKEILDSGEESARNAMRLVMLDIHNEYQGLQFYQQAILSERKEQLKNVMAIVISSLKGFYRASQKGLLSPKRAQKMALDWIQTIRYGNNDYFFINDIKMVAISHPDPQFLGKNLREWRDPKGNYIGHNMLDIALKRGSGFTRYWWKRLATEEPVEKLAYVVFFPQWRWIVGTGVYIDDINAAVQAKLKAIIAVLTDTFNKIAIAKTGYVFLFNGKKEMLIKPHLLSQELANIRERDVLLERLMQAARHPERPLQYTITNLAGRSRTKEAYVDYFPPLDWYVASSLFKDEIYLPARRLVYKQIFLLAIICLVGIGVAYVLVDRISRPLKKLTAYAKELPSRDFTAPPAPDGEGPGLYLNYRDEVGRLAASFDFMESALRREIQDLITTTAAKERIDSELHIAREIQMGILPKTFPPFPDRRDFDIYAAMEPAKEVGGDFYDFFLLDDHHCCFVIGDVSDKGVPAALYMAVTKTLIKAVAEQGHPPGQIFTRVNRELVSRNTSSMFVTVFLGILNTISGQVLYANGGHNPPLVMRSQGPVAYLSLSGGTLVGALEDLTYETQELVLSPGDALFLYTDGVTEAVNRDGELFSEDRLQQSLQDLQSTSIVDAVHGVQARVHAFAAGLPQADDITLLMVRFTGA